MRNFIPGFPFALVLTLAITIAAPALAENGGEPLAPSETTEMFDEGAPTAPADGIATGGSLDAEPEAEPAPVKKKKAKKVAKKKAKKKKIAKKNAKKKNAKKKKNRKG